MNQNSTNVSVILDAPGYERLAHVLLRAFHQAAQGKGKERHAQSLPFHQQPMQKLIGLYGVGFALGQAAKKAQESQRLPHERAVAELLGAINYLAGAVIAMEGDKPMEGVELRSELSGHVHLGHANDNGPQDFIPWGGGICRPFGLGSGDLVRVRTRSGHEHEARAGEFGWSHINVGGDIVGYRRV
jgi:hypothetical protein